MEEKARELYSKYLKVYDLMSKSAAKQCAFLEIRGRIEELKQLPGTEFRIGELEQIKEQIFEI